MEYLELSNLQRQKEKWQLLGARARKKGGIIFQWV